MKAEELMIGNFVSYKGKSHKVTGITPPYVDIIESDGRGFIEVHEEEIEPIEITRDICENNFSGSYRHCFILDWLELKLDRQGYIIMYYLRYIGIIRHLYELQNIFYALEKTTLKELKL